MNAQPAPNISPRVRRSMELYAKAERLIPGGTQLISRRPSRYANGVSPAYAARAKGARFWDVDGNEYIDWVSGIGAIILGYADPVVDGEVDHGDVDPTVVVVVQPGRSETRERPAG